MRQTQIRRDYDTLHAGEQPAPLHRVTIAGHAHLGDVTAHMAPGVTVLCGVSGVGKSQFLRTLAAHLQGHGTGDVTVQVEGSDLNPRGTRADNGTAITHDHTTVRCFHVDTARECYDTINQVTKTVGLEERRDAADKTPLSKQWSQWLGYILGRDYDNATFQELDRESANDADAPVWHYYELTYQGVIYGPHEMSLGELAASVILRVLRSTQRGDVLLLDEPENFLSPQARQHLLDVIVKQAVDKKLSVVIASHSSEIINRLSPSALRTVERGTTGANITTAQISSQATRAIGLNPRPQAILFVEDNFAHRLLKAILVRLLPSLHMDLGIVAAGKDHGDKGGGEGAVAKTAEVLSNNDIGLRVLGILDGDCREKPNYQRDYLAFLPGRVCPEDVVMQAVSQPRTRDAAADLDVSEVALVRALRAAEGADAHDRPSIVSKAIGVEVSDLISCTARWLVGSTEHQSDLESLKKQMLNLLDPHSTELSNQET